MLQKQVLQSSPLVLILFILLLIGCEPSGSSKAEALYNSNCGSCHLAPDINNLPRDIWENNVLPDMAARMGIKELDYNPFRGLSFDEMEATMKTGIYSTKPLLGREDWNTLKNYILSMAPDSLASIPDMDYQPMEGFESRRINLDSIPGSMNFTYMEYKKDENKLTYANLAGLVGSYHFDSGSTVPEASFSTPAIDYSQNISHYITTIGRLNPTQVATGEIFEKKENRYVPFGGYLHRPVHTLVKDLNGDGMEEIVICEFGDLVGKLSLYSKDANQNFQKRTLLNQPGSIRTIAKDMNEDDMDDLIVLTAQGEEGITIFYQEESLKFRPERVLRFSPVYGTSWFDLVDYDGDGDEDIITANGDNADKSYVPKPYHGFRIFINDGQNNFEEAYFYPMHGATRVLSRDFDKDGDMDFCLLATFPNYDKEPLLPFVYLQNEDSENYQFSSKVLDRPEEGRWLLVDAGDVDQDGDEDIILGPFTYIFTPVPEELNTYWQEKGPDLLILENKMIDIEGE